jgi:hypothetical protein
MCVCVCLALALMQDVNDVERPMYLQILHLRKRLLEAIPPPPAGEQPAAPLCTYPAENKHRHAEYQAYRVPHTHDVQQRLLLTPKQNKDKQGQRHQQANTNHTDCFGSLLPSINHRQMSKLT